LTFEWRFLVFVALPPLLLVIAIKQTGQAKCFSPREKSDDWLRYALEQASPAAGLSFTSGGQLASMIKRLANFGAVARIAHLN
jgi:hypothetical protein